jgi:hypothetical protein
MPNNYSPPPAMRLYPSSCLERNGRLTFPFRETAVASPSEQIIKAGESPRLDRSRLDVPSAKNALPPRSVQVERCIDSFQQL